MEKPLRFYFEANPIEETIEETKPMSLNKRKVLRDVEGVLPCVVAIDVDETENAEN